jgi:hypothetical protein
MAHLSFRLTAVYEPAENGWTQARLVELPAVITAGPTLEETKVLLLDVLREYLLALGEQVEDVDLQGGGETEPVELTLSA